ncbi:MAG TPA: hypothetical protein PK052_06990, partial [Anaerohalosphaeraceae bacterium]|nr:hypothetical protein [Anaerohalosphaeraceae bacterium]
AWVISQKEDLIGDNLYLYGKIVLVFIFFCKFSCKIQPIVDITLTKKRILLRVFYENKTIYRHSSINRYDAYSRMQMPLQKHFIMSYSAQSSFSRIILT